MGITRNTKQGLKKIQSSKGLKQHGPCRALQTAKGKDERAQRGKDESRKANKLDPIAAAPGSGA